MHIYIFQILLIYYIYDFTQHVPFLTATDHLDELFATPSTAQLQRAELRDQRHGAIGPAVEGALAGDFQSNCESTSG